jgi:glutamine amidotransferase PdxT
LQKEKSKFQFVGKIWLRDMLRFRTPEMLIIQGGESTKMELAVLYITIVQIRFMLRNGSDFE